MQPERLPIFKAFDTPFLTFDDTSVEMGSILFLFLIVALISQVRQRRQRVRRLVQLASLLIFFYVVYSCLGVFGMIRNGLYGLTLLGSAYTESFYWMALPVVVICVTLVRGAVFCGWICPTGFFQDLGGMLRNLFVKRPIGRTRVRLVLLAGAFTGFMALVVWQSVERQLFVEDSSLHWGASLLLLVFLVLAGIAADIPSRSLRAVSLIAIFVSALSRIPITSPIHFAFTARGDPASAITTLVIVVAALFVGRAWCRYLCPWGYLMGKLQRFARVQIVRHPARCDDCGKCTRECQVGAIDSAGIRAEHCQFCYACVDKCPRGACEVVDVWQAKELVSLGSDRVAPRA